MKLPDEDVEMAVEPRVLTPAQELRKTELVDALAAKKEERKNLREERRKLAAEIEEREKLRKELKGKLDVADEAIGEIVAELKSLS